MVDINLDVTGYGYADYYPIVFDSEFYWFADFAKGYVYAYNRMDDLITAKNHVKEFPLISGYGAFTYDPHLKLYWRADGGSVGGRDTLRAYNSIEDAAMKVNAVSTLSYRLWGADGKFTILR